MHGNGWRKPTPGLGIAEQLAQAGERVSIPKNKALLAIKRVAASLGLKASDMMLLDTFGAFTKPQDWEEGRRPIVWASNAYLMEQTGFSLSALRRHARRLVEAGLIAFKDSSNGKRWGHRDDHDYIIEAYGYDLSPLAARADEFVDRFTQIQDDRAFCQRTKRQITITRRIIRAKVEQAREHALQGPWKEITESFEALLERLPRANAAPERLLDMLNWLTALKDRVDEAFFGIVEREDEVVENIQQTDEHVVNSSKKMIPRGVNNDTHILDTKQLNPVTSNTSEDRKKKRAELEKPRPEDEDISWSTFGHKKQRTEIDVATVMQSCPSFAEMAHGLGGYVKNWNELHRSAATLRPMIGISEPAWNIAQERLGPQVAAAAIALIYDKYSAGEVASPGGYLRGMVEKAGAGELHLDRSFYGRLSEHQAA
ncbi:MAG: replication protein C [Rhodobacteraceae bacterium]|nr:replication protein C [Paracoccaceae bacterium]